MNRGLEKRTIFLAKRHYLRFLELLGETVEQWNIKIHAYSLMPNHYHLLVETPLANISQAMRHINGVYTQWFNYMEKRDGPLFRGRYKSILVEENAYLVELFRYIHLNPVRAKLSKKSEDHQWSSFRHYVASKSDVPWLTTRRFQEFFGENRTQAHVGMRKFLEAGVPESLNKILTGNRWPSVFSSDNFGAWIHWNFVKDLQGRDLSYSDFRRQTLTDKDLRRFLCQHFSMEWTDLVCAQGRKNKARRALCVGLFRRYLLWDYEKLSREFGNLHPSSISRAIEHGQKQQPEDWEFLNAELQNAKRKT